jgi:hypothetical protein
MRKLILATTAVFVLVVGLAAASTPEEKTAYKEQVEPICKVNSQANEKILKNVRKEVKAGKLKTAGAKFLKASTALKSTYTQLKAVPQPPSDAAKLTKWLGYVKTEANLFGEAGNALKAGKKGKAQSLVNKLNQNATLANNTVISYTFKYCKFEPSKFT